MFKVVGGAGTGKSKKIMLEAAKNGGIFVCKDANKMYQKSLYYGIKDLFIIPYSDFVKEYRTTGVYYIDDVEEFMEYFCPAAKGFGLSI